MKGRKEETSKQTKKERKKERRREERRVEGMKEGRPEQNSKKTKQNYKEAGLCSPCWVLFKSVLFRAESLRNSKQPKQKNINENRGLSVILHRK